MDYISITMEIHHMGIMGMGIYIQKVNKMTAKQYKSQKMALYRSVATTVYNS